MISLVQKLVNKLQDFYVDKRVSNTELLENIPQVRYVQAGDYTMHDIPKMPPIRQQGRIGSCASHAVISALEIQGLNQKRKEWELSELYHYYYGRKEQGTFPKATGMTMLNAVKTAKKYGVPLEFTHPYGTMEYQYNAEPGFKAKFTKDLAKPKGYRKVYSLTDVKKYINEDIPVVFGIQVYNNFRRLPADSTYHPDTNTRYEGGHAVTIVGYDDEAREFKIRNSWGKNHGEDGYFYMSYQDVLDYGFDMYVLIL